MWVNGFIRRREAMGARPAAVTVAPTLTSWRFAKPRRGFGCHWLNQNSLVFTGAQKDVHA